MDSPDPYFEDIKQIVKQSGENPETISGKQKLNICKEELQYSFYRPVQIELKTPPSSKFYNPHLELYKQSPIKWNRTGFKPPRGRTPIISPYPEYIFTDKAIKRLAKFKKPILELGAGAGFHAHMLSENECRILPTDEFQYPNKEKRWIQSTASITDQSHRRLYRENQGLVEKVDAISAINLFEPDAILISHPSSDSRWARESLIELKKRTKTTQETTVFYVGEWFPGQDGTASFFKELADNWNLENKYPLVSWDSSLVGFYEFKL